MDWRGHKPVGNELVAFHSHFTFAEIISQSVEEWLVWPVAHCEMDSLDVLSSHGRMGRGYLPEVLCLPQWRMSFCFNHHWQILLIYFFQMYCLTWFSWSGEMQICISWVEKGETRNKLLLWCIYNLKPWMESSTLLRTQTYFSEWLARRRLWLWNLLYVWFKYWVWAHSPTLLSAPCITVTTKQSLSLQAALQLCPSERLKIFATGVRFRRCTGRGKGDVKKRSSDFFPESYISKCASNISYGECIQLSLTAF